MKVAAVQMRVVDGDGPANRARAAELLDSNDADLYLLPELWTSGYAFDRWAPLADEDTPLALEWMSREARHRSAWFGGSVIARHEGGSLANRFLLFDRHGRNVAQYDKAHLFTPMQEQERLCAGNGIARVDVEGRRAAAAICYDLRFPEMFRRIALGGVDLFLVPSEWPHPRQRAMSVLAEARAIENQAFLLLANRCGSDSSGNVFCGHSALFGPFGVIAEAGEEEGCVGGELDGSLLESSRALRVLEERRAGVDFE